MPLHAKKIAVTATVAATGLEPATSGVTGRILPSNINVGEYFCGPERPRRRQSISTAAARDVQQFGGPLSSLIGRPRLVWPLRARFLLHGSFAPQLVDLVLREFKRHASIGIGHGSRREHSIAFVVSLPIDNIAKGQIALVE